MNALPAFFETASVFQKILSQSDPRTYRKMMFERDVNFVRNVWDTYECESGVLSRQEALNVLRSASEIHWKDELEGLSPNEIDDMIMTFVDSDGSRGISFSDIKRALRASTSRSYFSGCKEIQLRNSVGRDLKVSTKDVLERYRVQHPHMTESVLQQFLNSLQSIDAGNSAAISLKESSAQNKSRPHELLGRLFFFTDGYKMIDDVMISPYQSLMFPLTRRKKRPGRKVKRSRNASGFTPFLTVVPKSDSLDSITLGEYFRSICICT